MIVAGLPLYYRRSGVILAVVQHEIQRDLNDHFEGITDMSVTTASATDHAAAQGILDRAVTEGGLPGILAEVWRGDERWFGAAGVSDLESDRPRRQGDRFRIGSTTKTFVATMILRLVAEGRLSLDDPVDQWLPGVVQGHGHDGGRITIRQLLNHTSGIFNYSMDPGLLHRYYTVAFLEHRFDHYEPAQLVEIAMAHPPEFEPGTGWGYSNTAFILAGMIIERITETAFADELDRVIVGPLELTGTSLPRGTDSTLGVPHGRYYSKVSRPEQAAQIFDVTELNTSAAWTAGGLISTAGDLARFFGALLAGQLLPAAEQQEMFSTIPTRGWVPNARYGLGLASVELSGGVTVWGMGGAINGSWNYTFGSRDGRHVISSNVNGDWADGEWTNPIDIFTDLLVAEFH